MQRVNEWIMLAHGWTPLHYGNITLTRAAFCGTLEGRQLGPQHLRIIEMTRNPQKIEVNIESLAIFLKATHNDLLAVNIALHHHSNKIITNAAIKVNRHRIERLWHVISALELGENLIGMLDDGDGK